MEEKIHLLEAKVTAQADSSAEKEALINQLEVQVAQMSILRDPSISKHMKKIIQMCGPLSPFVDHSNG